MPEVGFQNEILDNVDKSKDGIIDIKELKDFIEKDDNNKNLLSDELNYISNEDLNNLTISLQGCLTGGEEDNYINNLISSIGIINENNEKSNKLKELIPDIISKFEILRSGNIDNVNIDTFISNLTDLGEDSLGVLSNFISESDIGDEVGAIALGMVLDNLSLGRIDDAKACIFDNTDKQINPETIDEKEIIDSSINLEEIINSVDTIEMINHLNTISGNSDKISKFIDTLEGLIGSDNEYTELMDDFNDMLGELDEEITDRKAEIDGELPNDLVKLEDQYNGLLSIKDSDKNLAKEYIF